MKMDASKFKKLSSDEKKTVFQHPRGHKIEIVHAALSPKMRKDLQAIPGYADGGDVKPDEPWYMKAYHAVDNALTLPDERAAEQKKTAQQADMAELNKMADAAPAVPVRMGALAPQANAAPAVGLASVPQQAPAAATAPSLQNQDALGMDAYANSYMKGVNEQKAGFSQEAAAQQGLGQQQMAVEQEQQQWAKQAVQDYQAHYQQLNQEYANVVKDVQNQHINPQHYMENMSGGKKAATIIGMLLSGIGSGLTHQENMAFKMLNQQIDRDVDAQKANLGKSENLLNANLKQFGNLHDATQMTYAMQNGIYASKLRQAAAQAAGPMAKARALQLAGQLDAQAAPIIQQIAMKKAVLGGMNGVSDPASKIRYGSMAGIIPKGEEEHLYKELGEAQNMVRARDDIMSAFDQVSKLNTVGNRLSSPIQSRSQIHALVDPLIAKLSKDTAGRFTEQDAQYLASVFPSMSDNEKSLAVKRRQIDKLVSEKMQFPRLKAYGINPLGGQKYGEGGQKKIQLGAPVR